MGLCVGPHSYTWTGVFSPSPTRGRAIATQLTLVSARYESAAHVVGPRRRAPAHGRARTARADSHSCETASCLRRHVARHVPRRMTRGQLGAAAACRPPDPFMEQLHVAMSVVGRQAAGVSATPALPQPSGAAQVSRIRTGRRCGDRPPRRCTNRPPRRDRIGGWRQRRRAALHASRCPRGTTRGSGAAAVCRAGVPCGAGPRCAMEPSWCRMVRIFGAVRALDWV